MFLDKESRLSLQEGVFDAIMEARVIDMRKNRRGVYTPHLPMSTQKKAAYVAAIMGAGAAGYGVYRAQKNRKSR